MTAQEDLLVSLIRIVKGDLKINYCLLFQVPPMLFSSDVTMPPRR